MRVAVILIVGLSLLLQTCFLKADDIDGSKSVPKAIDFGDYVRQYQKSYDPVETIERAKLFFGRTISIFKHNVEYASKKIGHFLRQTEFIDKSPTELAQKFSIENSDFQPVEEATRWPDYPANDYWKAQKDGGYSKLGVGEPQLKAPRAPSSVNFLQEPAATNGSSDDIKRIANREQLRIAARLSSRLHTADSELETKELMDRESKGIKYRPKVEPNNANYDPTLLPSEGVYDHSAANRFEQNYATFMMNDLAVNLQPYPAAAAPASPSPTLNEVHPAQREQEMTSFGFSLSSFVSSIKSISDYFDPDSEQMDIDEEEDAKQSGQANVAVVSPPPTPPNSLIDPQLLQPIEYDINWRQTGCISMIKSQKDCNACYAMATLDLMEFFYCRQKKIATEFSVQYVIDCGSKSGLNGCQGGKLSSVGNFIRNYGIQLNAFYPFRYQQQECPFDSQDYTKKLPYPIKPEITGWKMFTQISDWYKWLPRSPLIVGISMPADFFAYGGGIHEGLDCVPEMVHAMLLVGSGVQDGKQFWLLKNSFSFAWGENGYFRLSKQAPLKCFNSAVVARANFNVAYH